MLMSKRKSLSMALIMAYRALAAPASSTGAPSADIQAVIAALKVELQAVTPDASSLVDSIDAQLRLNGALSDAHIAALEQALVEMSPQGTIDATAIADNAILYLDANGAFENEDAGEIETKTVIISTEMINRVLSDGLLSIQDCPHKGRLCGGCVIL